MENQEVVKPADEKVRTGRFKNYVLEQWNSHRHAPCPWNPCRRRHRPAAAYSQRDHSKRYKSAPSFRAASRIRRRQCSNTAKAYEYIREIAACRTTSLNNKMSAGYGEETRIKKTTQQRSIQHIQCSWHQCQPRHRSTAACSQHDLWWRPTQARCIHTEKESESILKGGIDIKISNVSWAKRQKRGGKHVEEDFE